MTALIIWHDEWIKASSNFPLKIGGAGRCKIGQSRWQTSRDLHFTFYIQHSTSFCTLVLHLRQARPNTQVSRRDCRRRRLALLQTSSWWTYLKNRKGQVWHQYCQDLEGRKVLKKKYGLWVLWNFAKVRWPLYPAPGQPRYQVFVSLGRGGGRSEHWAGKIAENTLFSVRTIA